MAKSISIAIPVLNEEAHIAECLASVSRFTVPDGWQIEEVLVLDGGSSDATMRRVSEIAKSDARIKLLQNPGRIQSCALNSAILNSRGAFLLRLDAHASYPSDYLANCALLSERTAADNVGGIVMTKPGGSGYGAQAVQALTTHKFGVGDSGFRTGGFSGQADTVPFGFFRKAVFAKIGLFDERLVRAQDYELNRRISVSGGMVWMDSEIQASYFNQKSLSAFYKKQLFREAPYNAYMWHLAPYSFAYRHAVTALFTAGVLAGILLWQVTVVRNIYSSVLLLYAALALVSSIQQAFRYGEMRHVFFLPACFFAFHFLHGLGVILGLVALVFNVSPVQRVKVPWSGARQYRPWPPPDANGWGISLIYE